MRTWSRQSLTCQPARADGTAAAQPGQADTRSAKGPGSITRDTASAASSSFEGRFEPQRSDRFVSGCTRRASRRAWGAARFGVWLYRPTSRAGATHHKQPIGEPFPERVSAFPSSGKGPRSVACVERRPAFPSSGKGPRSVACIELVSAFPGEASDRLAETLTRCLHGRQIRVEGHREMTQQQASGRQHA